nr:hypothetical protein [Tanacetum cinerariifolium]
EDLDGDGERQFDCLTFALVSSKAHREGCRDSRGILVTIPKMVLRQSKLFEEMAFRNFIYIEDDDDL